MFNFGRGSFLLAVVLLAVALSCGCQKKSDQAASGDSSSADAADPETGKVVFQQACINCHGPNGQGMPHNGAPLTTSTFVANHTDKELIQFIKEGRAPWAPDNKSGVLMPPNGNLPGGIEDDRLADVVAYIRELQKKAKAATATNPTTRADIPSVAAAPSR